MTIKYFSSLNKDFFGFDDLFYTMDRILESDRSKTYPPHNVIKNSENEYFE